MSLYNDFIKNLNEGTEVKKTYGDKPQDGKTEKLTKGKSASVPKGKGNIEKYKARKLEKNNAQAADIYISDTDKVIEKIDSTEHSDKGDVAKIGTRKSDKKVKFPFGDKVQASDSKLIKEGKNFEDRKDKITEDYDNGTWMKYQHMIEGTLESAKEDMDEDAFQDFCEGVINLVQNYKGDLNQFECAGKKCEGEKLEESDATKDFVEDLKNFLNKHCRQDIKVAELSEDGNIVTLDNIKVNIGADSNLAAVLDIVNKLLK